MAEIPLKLSRKILFPPGFLVILVWDRAHVGINLGGCLTRTRSEGKEEAVAGEVGEGVEEAGGHLDVSLLDKLLVKVGVQGRRPRLPGLRALPRSLE